MSSSSSLSVTPTPTTSIPSPTATPAPPEEEEYYSSWSLFLVCGLLILSLWTSYYLQIKRIRAIHETLVAIIGGMIVGLVVRLAPGTMIREMLVSRLSLLSFESGLVPCICASHGALWAREVRSMLSRCTRSEQRGWILHRSCSNGV